MTLLPWLCTPSAMQAPRQSPPSARAAVAGGIASCGRMLILAGAVSLAFMRPQLSIANLAAVPTDALFALAAGCWFAAALLDRYWRVWNPIFFGFALYFAAMVASVAFAQPPFGKLYLKLASELYLLGVPVVIAGLLRTERQIAATCQAWLVGIAALSVLAAVSFVTAILFPATPWLRLVQHRLGSLPLGPFVRYRMAYENPNMLGAYLSLSLMIAILAIERRWIGRAAGIAAIAGIGVMTVATFSAGIGGVMLVVAIWVAITAPRPRPVPIALLLTILVLGALLFVLAQVVTPYRSPGGWICWTVPGTDLPLYASSRLQTWTDAWATFWAHPLTGIGIGNDVAHVRFREPSGHFVWLFDAHNVALNIAAACGLPGVIALALILWYVGRTTLAGLSDRKDGVLRLALGLGVLDVLVYQGVGGGFEDARFVWVALGLLLASMPAEGLSKPPRYSATHEIA